MKKIEKFIPKSFEVDYDQMVNKFMADAVVSDFVMKNDLTHDTIIRGSNLLLTFIKEKRICSLCKGLYECKLDSIGFWPTLSMYHEDIDLVYEKCKYNKADGSRQNINAFYVPKKIFQASIDDFDMIGPERKEIQRYMLHFLKNYSKDQYVKGMYLSGIYGTGKTYILATIANELAKVGRKITFVYYPDLVRELKSVIGTPNFEEKIDVLKSTEILFLDDIGGETPNAFIRDEVLGPILQYRLLDQRPTFFSSNLKPNTLINAMCKDDSALEKTKAIRIVERIKSLTEAFTLTEKPHVT